MRPNRCVHLTQTEAYVGNGDAGNWKPAEKYLCSHADNVPEKYQNLPRWLQEWALSGGPSFSPEKHCAGCSTYSEGP